MVDYTEEFEKIKLLNKIKKGHSIMKKKKEDPFISNRYEEGLKIMGDEGDYDLYSKAATARILLGQGAELSTIIYSLMGARIYEKIGKGYVAVPKLLRAVEQVSKRGPIDETDMYQVGLFIKRNSQKPQKQGKLEKSVGVTGSILGFGGALTFLSLNFTGNVIGNITPDSSSFTGLIFLAIGIFSAALLIIKD